MRRETYHDPNNCATCARNTSELGSEVVTLIGLGGILAVLSVWAMLAGG